MKFYWAAERKFVDGTILLEAAMAGFKQTVD